MDKLQKIKKVCNIIAINLFMKNKKDSHFWKPATSRNLEFFFVNIDKIIGSLDHSATEYN